MLSGWVCSVLFFFFFLVRRRPPRSTQRRSSAASDVYKRQELKEALDAELKAFQTTSETLDEVYENKDQIEVSCKYEQMPKPTLLAIAEYLNGKLYWRNPVKEI